MTRDSAGRQLASVVAGFSPPYHARRATCVSREQPVAEQVGPEAGRGHPWRRFADPYTALKCAVVVLGQSSAQARQARLVACRRFRCVRPQSVAQT